MKCHYAVLGVNPIASMREIYAAYGRQIQIAKKFGTDGNKDKGVVERYKTATRAFDVLFSPSERRWYDTHREEILNGVKSIPDGTFDIFMYFDAACFENYVGPKSFYVVYGMVFKKIAEEDTCFAKEDYMQPPDFGDLDSSYKDVVQPFYAHWNVYSTLVTYPWLDPHDAKGAKNRSTWRLAEMKNQKIRKTAIRKRNEEILALVTFVRNRDHRFHHAKIEKLEQKKMMEGKQSRKDKKKGIKYEFDLQGPFCYRPNAGDNSANPNINKDSTNEKNSTAENHSVKANSGQEKDLPSADGLKETGAIKKYSTYHELKDFEATVAFGEVEAGAVVWGEAKNTAGTVATEVDSVSTLMYSLNMNAAGTSGVYSYSHDNAASYAPKLPDFEYYKKWTEAGFSSAEPEPEPSSSLYNIPPYVKKERVFTFSTDDSELLCDEPDEDDQVATSNPTCYDPNYHTSPFPYDPPGYPPIAEGGSGEPEFYDSFFAGLMTKRYEDTFSSSDESELSVLARQPESSSNRVDSCDARTPNFSPEMMETDTADATLNETFYPPTFSSDLAESYESYCARN